MEMHDINTTDAISGNSLLRLSGNNYQPLSVEEEIATVSHQKKKGLSRTQRKKQQAAAKRRSKLLM